jgi:hypothetical protein
VSEEFFTGRSYKITLQKTILLLSALLFSAARGHAQGREPNAEPISCTNEITVGVRVIRLPEAEQHKVTISEFSITASKNTATYDLAMHIKNGTDNWCITSFSFSYFLGDARGQEWVANEYPAVVEFKTRLDPPAPVKVRKSTPVVSPHSIGLGPGQDEKRVVFDIYNYILTHPNGYFDGFHLISAEIKYCMGYVVAKGQ